MRNKLFLLISFFLIFTNLTACVNFIPEMDEETEKQVVRYMADAVITHDSSYESNLLDEAEKKEALLEEEKKAEELEKIVEEENKKKEDDKKNNTPDNVKTEVVEKIYTMNDLSDYLNENGVTFEYAGYEVAAKYPNSNEAGTLVYKPELGNLLIVKINICNISGNSLNVDLTDNNVKTKIVINDDIKINSVNQTFFLEAFNNFREDMASEKVMESVILFELEEDVNVEKLDLLVKSSDKEQIKINLY